MSYGPDDILTRVLNEHGILNPRGIAEELIEALEAEEYIPAHRSQIIWFGERRVGVPKGYAVHHIDGNRNNHRLDNLRLVKLDRA